MSYPNGSPDLGDGHGEGEPNREGDEQEDAGHEQQGRKGEGEDGPDPLVAAARLGRVIRSMTRVCARDVTDDVTSLPLRSLFVFSVPVATSSIGTLERCAAATLRASLTICSHSVK